MSPVRVQRSRAKGSTTPLCSCGCGKPARYVGRGTRWGNPWRWQGGTSYAPGWWEVREAWPDIVPAYDLTECFLYVTSTGGHAAGRASAVESFVKLCKVSERDHPDLFAEWLAPLAGHDLACWCPPDLACHADVLLELANQEPTP